LILAQEQPFLDWAWVFSHLDDILAKTLEHIQLTGTAVLVGFIIAFPLSILAFRNRSLYPPLTWFTGLLYTIPSLALFVFLIPYTGLSMLSAEIGLVSYTLLILIRNIVAGLDGVPESAKEAARGMGYTDRQLLWKVEVPLALPVILAGVRIATVSTVGLVTVASLIGHGGLGFFILRGLNRFRSTEILVGAVASAVLAVVLDAAILYVQKRLSPWSQERAHALEEAA
jgi:osmoprotectant transport system permease protein